MSNTHLHKAKKAKNDEFYTRYEDIEKELIHYKDQLQGKIVYCPCDTPESNFVKFFTDHFQEYGLKRLIATGYNEGGQGTYYRYDGKNLNVGRLEGNGDFRSEECTQIMKDSDIVITNPPFSLFRQFIKWLNYEEE